ncbi:MAG: MotA/TolQ/ExbB proton channel family protein [Planctomycetes bacterium]|nr:MotA/TolQ/ExbB proton channel family protein [Planctomycetota bacterium]
MSLQYVLLLVTQATEPPDESTAFDMITKGGTVGYIIIALSLVALALVVMHFLQLKRAALLPPEQLTTIEELLSSGKVDDALEFCVDPINDTYLTRILAPGLLRYQRSAFGPFEIKSALEEAGEEQTSRLFRSTDALGLIGTVAPLLGLLGTVLGMVGAFETIGGTGSGSNAALASNISEALVTTMLGLILAIPCVTLFSFFRNRIEGLSSEASAEIERLVLYLEESNG